MMLTDLADVLRRAGLTVHEIAGWDTRGHGGGGSTCYCSGACDTPGQIAAVSSIVLHHTAGPATGEAPSLDVVRRGRTGLAGPLAQLVLGRSGDWYVVAAGKSWHAGVTFQPWQDNAHSIGIEAEATGTTSWPDVQYRSYLRGVQALATRYGVPVARVLGHKEVASPQGRKSDPNFSTPAFRAALYTQEVPMTVWTDPIVNGFGDTVPAIAVVNGTEVRVADVQVRAGNIEDKVNGLRTQIAGLAETVVGVEHRLGTRLDAAAVSGVDLDVLAGKVADLLATRLAS